MSDFERFKIFEISANYGAPLGEIDFEWLCYATEVSKRKLVNALQKLMLSKKEFAEIWLKQKGRLDTCPPLVRVFKLNDEIFVEIYVARNMYAIPLTEEALKERRKWWKEWKVE